MPDLKIHWQTIIESRVGYDHNEYPVSEWKRASPRYPLPFCRNGLVPAGNGSTPGGEKSGCEIAGMVVLRG